MISLSTAPVAFVPPWHSADDPKSPRYFLRPGSVIERGLFEGELSGEYRAGRVYDFELLQALVKGVEALLPADPERDALIALAYADAALEPGEKLEDAEALKLSAVRDILAEHWPEFRALVVRDGRRQEMMPILAFRRFCVGWENIDAAFVKGPDGLITNAALEDIPPLDIRVAGSRAYSMLYAGAYAKNSDAPVKSVAGQQTSHSGASSKGAGKSRVKNTPKTPS